MEKSYTRLKLLNVRQTKFITNNFPHTMNIPAKKCKTLSNNQRAPQRLTWSHDSCPLGTAKPNPHQPPSKYPIQGKRGLRSKDNLVLSPLAPCSLPARLWPKRFPSSCIRNFGASNYSEYFLKDFV